MSGEQDLTQSGLQNEEAFAETVILDDSDADIGKPGGSKVAPKPGRAQAPRWVGKRLGRFKLMRMLGQGGMGMVIQAQDIHLGRIVALKVLRKQIKGIDDQQRVDQFLREAKSAARIEHPNVAQVYEINEHEGWWYIATEMIEGGTLQQIVKAAGKLDPAQACPLIADAASVLDVAHRMGIIHRDIKPHNLMLTRDGRCKVVDFGLVRVEDPNDPFDFTERAVGTPLYLPPEAATRGNPTPAYDIYSLAATLYYTLSGTPPFEEDKLTDLIKLHTEAPRPDVREINPLCSERLAQLIQQGMAVDPADRPSAADFSAALRIESIGTEHDAASLVQKSEQLASPPDPHLASSDINVLPLSGNTAQGTRVLGVSRDGTLIVEQQHRDRWVWVMRIAAASVVIGVAIKAGFMIHDWYDTPPGISDRAAFDQRFPNAPAGYGTRQHGTRPPTTQRIEPPPFSWIGQADPGSNRFVASTAGSRAYSIDHPHAALIRVDLARFYPSAAEAERDGKTVVR